MKADFAPTADAARTVRTASRLVSFVFATTSLVALCGCAMALLNGASGGGGSTTSSSPSPARRPASQIAADDAITAAVRSRLGTNPALKPFNLAVDTHDGVVTLRGQVAKVEQRNYAQSDARAVKGVKSVANLLTVR
ncbi:MAG: BON domain-containing protein [Gammaproteobacteria bacterium]